MNCPDCDNEMLISGSTEPDTAEGSKAVYDSVTFVCVNPKCKNYAGTDTNKAKVFFTHKRPLNAAAREEMKVNDA